MKLRCFAAALALGLYSGAAGAAPVQLPQVTNAGGGSVPSQGAVSIDSSGTEKGTVSNPMITAPASGGGDASAANQISNQATPGADAAKATAVQGVSGGKPVAVTSTRLPASLGATTKAQSLPVALSTDGAGGAIGTATDPFSCLTDGTAISMVAILKCHTTALAQLHTDLLAPTPAGSLHIGSVGIDAAIPAPTVTLLSNATSSGAVLSNITGGGYRLKVDGAFNGATVTYLSSDATGTLQARRTLTSPSTIDINVGQGVSVQAQVSGTTRFKDAVLQPAQVTAGYAAWSNLRTNALPGDVIGLYVSAAAVVAGGSGNAVGDTLTLTGGAVLTVSAVSSGAVTAATITTPAMFACTPTNPVPVLATSGSATGATFNQTLLKPTLYGTRRLTVCYTGNLMTAVRSDTGETKPVGFFRMAISTSGRSTPSRHPVRRCCPIRNITAARRLASRCGTTKVAAATMRPRRALHCARRSPQIA